MNGDVLSIIKEVKELILNESFNVKEINIKFKEIEHWVCVTDKKDVVSYLGDLLNRKIDTMEKVFLYSFIVYMDDSGIYVNDFLNYVKNEKTLSTENKYFIWQQIMCKRFQAEFVFRKETAILFYQLFQSIVRDYKRKISRNYSQIGVGERNKNLVIVIVDQFLDECHGPTKSTLGRCRAIQKMGKQVMIINSAEALSSIGYLPFYNFRKATYLEELKEISIVEWNDIRVPYFQCDDAMPDCEVMEFLLNTIVKLKPYYIVEIGYSSLFASLANDIVPVLEVSMQPSQLDVGGGTCRTLGRRLNEEDIKFLETIEVDKNSIIEHIFTSDLISPMKKHSKEEFGFLEDDFVLLIIGGRIEKEMDEAFLKWLNEIVTFEKIKVLVVGPYNKEKDTIYEYKNLEGRIQFSGFVRNIMDVISVGDLYINPIRFGGGTSCVEAMSMGIPVITTNCGDVAVNSGEEFWTQDYDSMKELVLKYRDDKLYYSSQSEKAKSRAIELLDTETEFQKVIKRFCVLEHM